MSETQIFPQARPHLFVIVLIASLGAFNIAILTPSLADIAHVFGAPYAKVQLMLSGYMLLTAFMQLVIGPLSDRYGRRPVLLWSLAIFLAGTVLCIVAPDVDTLLAGRMIQATVISGLVLSRAIVRDIVPMEQAASMLGYVTMGMTLAPMIGPIIGGYFAHLFGWQANFVIILVFGLFVAVACYFALPETNMRRAANMGEQFRAWPVLIRSPLFWAYSATTTFGSGVYFSFLGGSPYVGGTQLGMSPTAMGYFFAFTAIGYIFGNYLSGRFATIWGPMRLMLWGSFFSALGGLVPLALFGAGLGGPMAFFLPMAFIGIGNGMTLPSANAGIVSVRPDLAGAASGLGGALTVGGGSALSVIGSWVLTPTSGPAPLLVVMACSALLAMAFTALIPRLTETDTTGAGRP